MEVEPLEGHDNRQRDEDRERLLQPEDAGAHPPVARVDTTQIEQRAGDPAGIEQRLAEVAFTDEVVEGQCVGHQDEADAPVQGHLEHPQRVRQRCHPEGVQDVLVAEDAAVDESEHHRRDARRDHDWHDLGEALAEEECGQRDDSAVPHVPEHHAEHQDEAQREQRGGIDLTVTRNAVVGDQRDERLHPAGVAHHRRDSRALLRPRVARGQDVRGHEPAIERVAEGLHVVSRDPPLDHREPAHRPHPGRELRVGLGNGEGPAGGRQPVLVLRHDGVDFLRLLAVLPLELLRLGR